MKKSSLLAATLTLASVCFLIAQNQPAPEKPKTWEEKAKERFGDTPTTEHKAAIDAGLPSATAEPKTARKVLVFYRCEGFIHTSIPFGNYAMKRLAETTKAFHRRFLGSILSLHQRKSCPIRRDHFQQHDRTESR